MIDPLIQSTYLGGSGVERIYDVALTSNGDVMVSGDPTFCDLPWTYLASPATHCGDGAQKVFGGALDGFVALLSGDLKTLKQSTYLGTSVDDVINSVAVTSDGDVIVGGQPGRKLSLAQAWPRAVVTERKTASVVVTSIALWRGCQAI